MDDDAPALAARLTGIVCATNAVVSLQAICRCFRRDERFHQTDPGRDRGFRPSAWPLASFGRARARSSHPPRPEELAKGALHRKDAVAIVDVVEVVTESGRLQVRLMRTAAEILSGLS